MTKVLIIEDSRISRELLEREMEEKGYQYQSTSDGFEGLKLAKKIKPDIILLDVMLPSMNGFKIARLLKFNKKYKDIPIIMLTSRDVEEDQKTGLSSGADIYMSKPFDSEILEAEMKKLLGDKVKQGI
ncbi:MAG: response regulator [Candidatus Latescibacteria bacterium]|nr:response regulator [bacterium]MBD3425269.1 response regulator [Candidatus Latescibacterota bacterium]